MKKLVSFLLCLVLTFGCMSAVLTSAYAAVPYAFNVGDIIEYGTYPQDRVTDPELLEELNKFVESKEKADDAEAQAEANVTREAVIYATCWSESIYGKETKYWDLIDNNGIKRYRAVRFSTVNGDYTEFYTYMPIKWRVLDPQAGVVVSESILDYQCFNSSFFCNNGVDTYGQASYYTDETCNYYANNYVFSSIRKFLGDDFYNAAFNDVQKKNIKLEFLDNRAFDDSHSAYDAEFCEDEVYLLGYEDIQNPDYNLTTSASRMIAVSDYAADFGADPYWILRTPGVNSFSVCGVNNGGYVYDNYSYSVNDCIGIRPAITLDELKTDSEGNGNKTGNRLLNSVNPEPEEAKDDSFLGKVKEFLSNLGFAGELLIKVIDFIAGLF